MTNKSKNFLLDVPSESTARYDRAEKFHAYCRLTSLQEYALVAQDTQRVEIYRRDTQWCGEFYTVDNPKLHLKSVDMALDLATIYENI